MKNTHNKLKSLLAITFIITSGCAFGKKNETPAAMPAAPAEKTQTSTSTPAASSAHAAVHGGTESEVALKWLKNGNIRFQKGFVRKDGQSQKDVQRLASGQKPHSIILSCSDSRVPPEVVFDQKLGEIFVVRTAGEAIEASSIASMEYAVEHLGVKNLVVMGHTQCGAVKAALATLDGKDAGSENLNKLVQDIHPRIQNFKGRSPSSDVAAESWANVEGVISDLKKRSKIIKEKMESHELTITGSLYHLDSGNVEFK